MELIDSSKTYEFKSGDAVFVLKHWTLAMQDEVDKATLIVDQKGQITFNAPLEREMKINLALHNWHGVTVNGEVVECTSENKKKIPVGIAASIVREIEEKAGLRITPEEKKN